MRLVKHFALLLCLTVCGGCGKKSTDQLIKDLKSSKERERIIAVRLLPERKEQAAQVIPALIQALKDPDGDVRRSAANGLGYFGKEAKEAIPALEAAQKDRDARVRESAAMALSRIDPAKFPDPHKAKKSKGTRINSPSSFYRQPGP
jgi:vesicle coat complex subunit